jgi:Serine hydrolase (FSH1)
MIIAGFPSGSLVHKNYYESKISIPSLHVFGLTDDIISHELSMKVQDAFDESSSTCITHGGGHYFPATTNEKQTYIDFYKNQLISYLEEKELKKGGVAIEEEKDEN